MGTLIDTSVFIAIERNKVDAKVLTCMDSKEEIVISVITVSELLHGVHRANSEERKIRREAFVERLIQRVPIVPFDVTVARAHARLWASLVKQGVAIGAHDLIIAATALAYDYRLATLDTRSFPKIKTLKLISW